MNHQGFKWLVRGKEGNSVEYQGQAVKTGEAADRLEMREIKAIKYKGQKVKLHVGKAEVWITRDVKPKQKGQNGKRVAPEKGKALRTRLIVAAVKNEASKSLTSWMQIHHSKSFLNSQMSFFSALGWVRKSTNCINLANFQLRNLPIR